MTMNDLAANYLTRLRNAILIGVDSVSGIPCSRLVEEISKVLKEEGYIKDYHVNDVGGKKTISVDVKYHNNKSVITKIEKVSRLGRRVYVQAKEIPHVREGLGISIISTSKGVMTDEKARELNVGGEIICKVW